MKRTSLCLSEITAHQLAELGGQQSETIRRAVAVLWVIEILGLGSLDTTAIQMAAEFACDPTDPHGTQRR